VRFYRLMADRTSRLHRLRRLSAGAVVSPYAYLRGVNAAGGEFGVNHNNPADTTDPATLPGRLDSDASFAFYAARGHKAVRLPFLLEKVQPLPGGPLDMGYIDGTLSPAVRSGTSRGMVVILDMHNYARRKGAGSSSTTGGLPTGFRATFNCDTLADKQQWAQAGGTHVVIQALWSDLEPTKGTLNAGKLAVLKQQFADCATAGVGVIFSFATHYTPDWIKSGPAAAPRFQANTYAEWASANHLGDDIPDVVFSKVARDAISAFQARLWAALTVAEKALIHDVRLGGGPYGELHYPSPGDPRRWWGNSAPAATGVGLADGMVKCPVSPVFTGTPSPAYVEWYLDALVRYMLWQIDQLRRLLGYAGETHMLLPSFGLRDNMAYGETGWSYQAAEGVAFERQIAAFRAVDKHVWPQCTWVNGEDPVPGGIPDSDRAAHRKIGELAVKYGCTQYLAGENTGGNAQAGFDDNADIDRMFSADGAYGGGGYKGLSWLNFPRLVGREAGVHATLAHLSQRMPSRTSGTAGSSGQHLVLGEPGFPHEHLADVWGRLAAIYRTDPLVHFGLMNEPHDLPAVSGAFEGRVVYAFDTSAQGWGGDACTVAWTSAVKRDGAGSLAVTANDLTNAANKVFIANDSNGNTMVPAAGKTLRAWVLVPAGATGGNWRARVLLQNGSYAYQSGPDTALTPGTWAEVSFTPPDALWADHKAVAVQFTVDSPTGTTQTVHVDTVRQGTVANARTPAQSWEVPAQLSLDAIRAAGASNWVWVAGYEWSNARRFWDIHPTWWIKDPVLRSGPEAHYYPDPDGNGVFGDNGDSYASATTAAKAAGYPTLESRVRAELGRFLDGCTARGLRGLIGEMGWPKADDSAQWNGAGELIYDLCDAAGVDVTYWAAGEPWGTGYEMSIYHGTPQSVPTAVAAVVEAHPSVAAGSGTGPTPTPTADTYSGYELGY